MKPTLHVQLQTLCKVTLCKHSCRHNGYWKSTWDFTAGDQRTPVDLEQGRAKTQPCYISEYHFNGIISHGLDIPCIESFQNLEYEIDVNSDEFEVLNDFPWGLTYNYE